MALTRGLRILGPEPDIENNRTKAGSKSSNNGICYGPRNKILVRDLKTMEPESGTNNDNLETESKRSRDGVCWWLENFSEDSEALLLKPELDNNNLETDLEYSGYKEHCRVEYGALLDLRFCSQNWLSTETVVEYRVWKVEGLPPSWVEITSWIRSGSPT